MPASFAKSLCGYRTTGLPNTSDSSDKFSIEIGRALFGALGVDEDTLRPEPTGRPFASKVIADLTDRVGSRSALKVRPEMSISTFAQYRHVGLLTELTAQPSKTFLSSWTRQAKFAMRHVARKRAAEMAQLIADVNAAIDDESEQRKILLDALGEEALLKLDITLLRESGGIEPPHLEVGLSLKWSLRTDRAQDCRVQAAKLASLRRGRMPHVAAITMEPRPYFLNILAQGSGDLDCVYHLDLAALTEAVELTCGGGSRHRSRTFDTFRRLVDQRRLRDYDELIDLVLRL